MSPAYVFYGRYSIHESWLVLFSILFFWGWLGLCSRAPQFLFAVLAAATGMILTKETYIIHIGSFLLAGLVLATWQKLSPSHPKIPVARQLWSWRDLANGGGIAVLTIVFFYSGTFLDFSALAGLYETFAAWFHTGVAAAGHEQSTFQIAPVNYYWVALMARYEWPALLGLIFCVRYVAPSDPRLRYLAIYGCGVLLAYSLIPYKTPWCVISLLWPFYLLLGSAIEEWSAQATELVSAISRLALVISLGVSAALSIWLNFYRFANQDEPYVYVQTFSDIEILTKPLLKMAERDSRYYHVRGHILLESYYPLPWMLGDFTQLGYYNNHEAQGRTHGLRCRRGEPDGEDRIAVAR